MIADFKAAESDPGILTQKIRFGNEAQAPEGGSQTIIPSRPIERGKEYTALELIERSIMYFDNQAVQLLYEHIDGKHVFDAYRRIGVDTSSIERPGAVLTPHEYRVLPHFVQRILPNARIFRTSSRHTDAS